MENGEEPMTFYEPPFDDRFDGVAYCKMIFNGEGRPIDFLYLQVNKDFEKFTGLSNVVGKKVTEVIPDVAVLNPKLFTTCSRVSLSGQPERVEMYIGSSSRWFLLSVYCTKKNFFVAVFQNITDKKRTEKDLNDAVIAARNVLEDLQIEKEKITEINAKDEALLQSIGDGVVATDKNGNVIVMNKVAENLLGFESKEILGKPFEQVIVMEDAKGQQVSTAERPVTLALTLGKTTRIVLYSFVRKDTIKFPVSITTTPVIINGKNTGAIIVFRDITKEKEIEKMRTDFLSLASHQLRTPLSGTKWLIETIQRGVIGEINPKQKIYLEKLYQINERMIRLVFEMLNVLTLENGDTITKTEEVSVSTLYKDLLLIMEPASKNKKVMLTNAYNDTALLIESNFQVLRNILESFVSNAISYSKEEQEVVLSAKEESDDVLFSVKDNGIGIPKEEQKSVFERFHRASNAKGVNPDGTGLGLYLASLLAQKIGGKVFFESEENKGSTFYLRIPKKRVGGTSTELSK